VSPTNQGLYALIRAGMFDFMAEVKFVSRSYLCTISILLNHKRNVIQDYYYTYEHIKHIGYTYLT
jgi:hypothetical protein